MFNFLKKYSLAKADTQKELVELEQTKAKLQAEIDNMVISLKDIQIKHECLNADIENAMDKIRFTEIGFGILEELGYERYIPDGIDEFTESRLFENEAKMAEMVSSDNAYVTNREYRVNNSTTQGKKFQKNYAKNLLMAFMNYIKPKFKSVTENNYYNYCDLIEKAFDKYNKQGELLGISISQDFLNVVKEVLRYTLDVKILKAEQKEALKEERRRIREEQKLFEEAEKERKKLEIERKSLELAFDQKLSDAERKVIKDKISKIDKRLEDIDWRISHRKAGWVYVIHSPSLPGMVKIGVSRRLNGPYERVRELSSSAIPEPYSIDGFCFNEDAFELENKMHKYFDSVRVAINREFFRTTANEAIKVLKNVYGQKIYKSDLSEDSSDD